MSRRRLLSAFCLAAFWVLTGCGGGVIQSVDELPPPPPGKGFLEIRCETAGAELFVDDVFQGEVARYREGVVPLPVGSHRLTIKAAGFYTWYGQAEITTRPTRIDVILVARVGSESTGIRGARTAP